VRDVVRILKRRFHNVISRCIRRVQGEGSAAEIVAALGYFNKRLPVDVMLLVRGGGSLEICGRSTRRAWRAPLRHQQFQ